MGDMTVGVDLRESKVVVVVERWEGVFKLEFGCDITRTFLEGVVRGRAADCVVIHRKLLFS